MADRWIRPAQRHAPTAGHPLDVAPRPAATIAVRAIAQVFLPLLGFLKTLVLRCGLIGLVCLRFLPPLFPGNRKQGGKNPKNTTDTVWFSLIWNRGGGVLACNSTDTVSFYEDAGLKTKHQTYL